MPASLTQLRLSHGQLIWSLCLGQMPEGRRLRHVLEQVRYLRLRGVPFRETQRGKGRGHRILYTFEDLIEVGLALYALRHGLRLKEVTSFLVRHRQHLRPLFHQALGEQPAAALDAPWLASRGRSIALLAHELYLRLHSRFSETPGRFDIITPDQAAAFPLLLGMCEVFPDQTAQPLIPLTRLVLELVYWARQAPDFTRGRKKRTERD